LIKTRPHTVRRYGVATIVNGKYVRPTPTEVQVEALVTPCIKRDIIAILPEALRDRKVIRILTNEVLREHNSQQPEESDEFVYDGSNYRVFKMGGWNNVSGYTAREAYAVQIDTKDLQLLT
jgi:ethanolamine utilization protein EutQ (cupin superfamily)